MATKKEEKTKYAADNETATVKTGVPESTELTAIAVKSLTNLEEKVEAIDWKLWEIYNFVKNYVESNPGNEISAPQVSQPQPSAADIASEIVKALDGAQEPEEKKSVVGRLFGK